MELRDGFKLGIKIEAVALSFVALYILVFEPQVALRFARGYLLGLMSMAVVIYAIAGRDEGGPLGSWRANRNFMLFLSGVPCLVLLGLISQRVPYEEYAWLVVALGGWMGNRVGWLLKTRQRSS